MCQFAGVIVQKFFFWYIDFLFFLFFCLPPWAPLLQLRRPPTGTGARRGWTLLLITWLYLRALQRSALSRDWVCVRPLGGGPSFPSFHTGWRGTRAVDADWRLRGRRRLPEQRFRSFSGVSQKEITFCFSKPQESLQLWSSLVPHLSGPHRHSVCLQD